MADTEAEEDAIVEEREELMISQNTTNPTRRKAHFLKPTDGPVSSPPFSDHLTELNHLPVKLINFNGWYYPHKYWTNWVDQLHSKFQSLWRKVGIYDSIMASRCKIWRHPELVLGLAAKWCPETNTFVFSWGEVSISLEDVMVLGGYSILGDPFFSPLGDAELEAVKAKLVRKRKDIGKPPAKKTTHVAWMVHFMNNESEIEHEAFLAYWLCRFVFPGIPHHTISDWVFPIAIRLARGTTIALAPAVLASIYRDLTLLNGKIVSSIAFESSVGDDNDNVLAVNLWAPFQLVQVWAWERFVGLGPCRNSIGKDDPRLARWDNLKTPNIGNVGFLLESNKECFLWRPYAEDANNNELLHKFYGEREECVLVDAGLDMELECFARCLRVCELVGMDCIEQYLPHRIARQFGMDQDIPVRVARCNGTRMIASKSYVKPINVGKLYVPSRFFEPNVTTRYLEWWKQSLTDWNQLTKGSSKSSKKSPPSSKVKSVCSNASVPHVEVLDSEEEDEVFVSQWLRSRGKKKEIGRRKDNELNPELDGQSSGSSCFLIDNGEVGRSELTEPVETRDSGEEDNLTLAELLKPKNDKKRDLKMKSSESNPLLGLRSQNLSCRDANDNIVPTLAYNNRTNDNKPRSCSTSELSMSSLDARICELERVFADLEVKKFGKMITKPYSGGAMNTMLGEKILQKKILEETVPCVASVDITKTIKKPKIEPDAGNGIIDKVIGELKAEFDNELDNQLKAESSAEVETVVAELNKEFNNRTKQTTL